MPGSSHSAASVTARLQPLLAGLFEKSGGRKYGMDLARFTAVLIAIAEKYLPYDVKESEVRELYLSLRCEELALARCCAAGDERAWEDFMLRYREKLHDAALSIAKEDGKARELAGSIYADLYGTGNREGERVSKLMYYSGRGSLEGWLRTVMAQRQVNEYRRTRNTVSLDEEEEAGRQFAAGSAEPAAHVDPRLNAAIEAALAALSGEERSILAYYFLDDLTLARIAAILRVHESTISRRLEKLVTALRKDIVLRLTHAGLSRRQAEEALEVDVRDLAVDIRQNLAQDSAGGPFSKEKIVRAGEVQD